MVAVDGIKGAFAMGTESMVVTCWRPPRPCTGRSFATDRSVGASRCAAEQEATWPAHLPRGRLRSGVAMDPSDDGQGRMRLARPMGSPRAVAGLPSGHTAHVIVVYAGTNDSTIKTAGDGCQRVPLSPPGASRVCVGGSTFVTRPLRIIKSSLRAVFCVVPASMDLPPT